MPERSRKPMPNPFYVLLLVASTAFVVTALAYYISPIVVQQAAEGPAGPGSLALVDWLDRRGPTVLGVEFGLMLVTGVLAMMTDHKFAAPKRPGAGPS